MDDTSLRQSQQPVGQVQLHTIVRLERILMAPCCYTQTIDVHSSEIAEKMRAEVRSMTFAGKSEAIILDYYKNIYGERILAVPDGMLGQLAYAIPISVTAFATGALLFVLKRFHARKVAISSTASGPAIQLSEAVREKIRQQTAW